MNTPNTNDAQPRIPRDLKPEDKLWFSETEFATVGYSSTGALYDDNSIRAHWGGGLMIYLLRDGRELCQGTPPIIRVERVTSAAPTTKATPKPDKDAAWLLRQIRTIRATPSQVRRLCAIAARLNQEPHAHERMPHEDHQ